MNLIKYFQSLCRKLEFETFAAATTARPDRRATDEWETFHKHVISNVGGGFPLIVVDVIISHFSQTPTSAHTLHFLHVARRLFAKSFFFLTL